MSMIEPHVRPSQTMDDEFLVRTVRAFEKRLEQLEAIATRSAEPPSIGISDDKMATLASSIYRSRRIRANYFPESLLGDPGWDMLLDLFINKVRGRRVSTTSLCLASNVPQATGVRWIEQLQKAGLVRRAKAPDDARLTLVEITAKGFQQMRRYIGESVAKFALPQLD
jgi:predicted transcriptional regulator